MAAAKGDAAENTLTPEIVAACYRVFLKCDPPDEKTVQDHIDKCRTVDAFLDRIIGFPEFVWAAQRSLSTTVRGAKLRGNVDTGGTATEMKTLMEHTRAVWASYGEDEPYYSVLTQPKYRGKTLTGKARDEFYASGANQVRLFFTICESNGLAPNVSGTLLDLGCGLGRVGEHFAARFKRYVGVDISAPHLEQATARFAEIGRSNGTFRLLSDYLKEPEMVDVVFSTIVLQHNPPPVIAMLIEQMCRGLRDNGILFFQVPTGLFNYRFDLAAYTKNLPAHGKMEMHCIPQRAVYRILAENGCRVVETFLDAAIGREGLSQNFLAVKPP